MIDYYREVLDGSVNLIHKRAKKEDIVALDPEVVIMATGSKPFLPCPPVRGFVYIYDDILRGMINFEGKELVVGGGGLVGCETALFLADKNKVLILEMLPEIAIGMETLSRKYLLKELKENNVQIITETRIVDVGKGEIVVETGGEQRVIEADALIAAFGSRPYIPFTVENIPTIVIGDAKSVRNIYSAVNEGFSAAISL